MLEEFTKEEKNKVMSIKIYSKTIPREL